MKSNQKVKGYLYSITSVPRRETEVKRVSTAIVNKTILAEFQTTDV